MNRRVIWIGVIGAALLAAGSWAAFAQGTGGKGAAATVAEVGRLTITRGELDERFDGARAAYRERTGEAIPDALLPTFRRTVLEQMIRARLLMLEAERQGFLVSEADAEQELKRSPFFNEGGRFSQLKFDAARRNSPEAFATALADARLRLSGARMEERVNRRHQPEEAALRAAIERELTTATVEVLALPFDEFDGRGAEPSEREVIDEWRAQVAHGEAPALAEAAPRIRERLRAERREAGGDEELRKLYEEKRDAIRGPAARVRYAFFDTTQVTVSEPSAADLDRYYRGHLADYSSFDASRGEIRRVPLDEVREDVRLRWLAERRVLEARSVGERLLASWERGRRDRRAEAAAALLHETGLVGPGHPVDSLRFGALLGDLLADRGVQPGTGMIDVPGGILAFRIHDVQDDFVPPFESVRDQLRALLGERRGVEEHTAARRMFDADPMAFARDSTLHFSRLLVPHPKAIDVPLTRAEVERYHREHIDEYSTPEVMTARHILIAPSGADPQSEQAARLKAEGLLQRIRAGEDFADLAREFSDDAVTRESGGELGSFGRGVHHPAFDRAVFDLRPGEVSDLVRTPEGYHIIRCTLYEPMNAHPLVEIYSNVGFDAAMEKAQAIARMRADSLLHFIRTPADGRRVAAEAGFFVYSNSHPIGGWSGSGEIRTLFERLDAMRPGEIYPLPVPLRGQGYVIAWLDSITPPRPPDYSRIQGRVIAEFHRRAGAQALDEKRSELDALEQSGWSFDSLAALFGGIRRYEGLHAGDDLPVLGGAAQIDSLVFGGSRRAALRPGETSGWVAFPGGLARVRLVESKPPPATEMTARLERDRRKEQERSLFFFYEDLKRSYTVRIRDAELAGISLPAPETSTSP